MTFSGFKYVNFHGQIDESQQHHDYTCGFCNRDVSGIVVAEYNSTYTRVQWLICPSCEEGSVYSMRKGLNPRSSFGYEIEGLPDIVKKAYQEARDCFSVNAYIACEQLCRKILMYVAVEKGAEDNEAFSYYIRFIIDKGYITEPMKPWVELIKEHGGKATHLIEESSKERAESTLMCTAQLLKIIYEMEYMANKYKPIKEKRKTE
jgi:hypothetical protein